MVGVEDAPGVIDVEVVVGTLTPRDVEQRVQPGADPAVLRALLTRALEPVDFLSRRLAHGLGEAAFGDATAELLDHVVATVLAQLLLDRAELLAEQELTLLTLHAVGDFGADLLGDVEFGQRVARPRDDLLQPLLDVERLEQLELALGFQVRPPPSRVRQRARLGHTVERLGEARRTEVLCDRADHRAVFAHQLVDASRIARLLRDRLGLDPQRVGRAGDADTDGGAVQAAQHEGALSVGKLAAVLDPGDRSDPGVTAVHAGDEEEQPLTVVGSVGRPLGLVAFERQRDDHLGQDHTVRQGQQRQGQPRRLGHQGLGFRGSWRRLHNYSPKNRV